MVGGNFEVVRSGDSGVLVLSAMSIVGRIGEVVITSEPRASLIVSKIAGR